MHGLFGSNSIVYIILIGFLVGLVARAIMPGRQKLGCLLTILLGIGALVLAQAVLVAALVGLLLTLREVVGQGWAALIVVGCGLVITVAMGWVAWVLVRRATEIKDKDERP